MDTLRKDKIPFKIKILTICFFLIDGGAFITLFILGNDVGVTVPFYMIFLLHGLYLLFQPFNDEAWDLIKSFRIFFFLILVL